MRRLLIGWLAVCIVVFAGAYFETQSPGLVFIAGGFYAAMLWLLYVDRLESRRRRPQ